MLQAALQDLIWQFSITSGMTAGSTTPNAGTPFQPHATFAAVPLPTCNLYFDGTNLEVLDLQGSLQRGGVSWCC